MSRRSSPSTIEKLVTACAAALLAGMAAVPAARAGVVIDRIVAIVNDDVIALTDLEEEIAERTRLMGATGKSPVGDREERALDRHVLSNMVEKSLQLQAAKKRGIGVGSDEIKTALDDIKKKNRFPNDAALEHALAAEGLTLPKYTEELRKRLTVLKMVDRDVKSGIVLQDDEVRAYYDAHKEVFALPSEIRLRQIFVATPAEAPESARSTARKKIERILLQLKAGNDFAETARQESEGPEKAQGGEMGVFHPGELLPEIEAAVKPLEAGQISGVVETPIGFHLVSVESKTSPVMPFDEVKKDVENILYQEKTEENLRRWMLDLRAEGFVDIRL